MHEDERSKNGFLGAIAAGLFALVLGQMWWKKPEIEVGAGLMLLVTAIGAGLHFGFRKRAHRAIAWGCCFATLAAIGVKQYIALDEDSERERRSRIEFTRNQGFERDCERWFAQAPDVAAKTIDPAPTMYVAKYKSDWLAFHVIPDYRVEPERLACVDRDRMVIFDLRGTALLVAPGVGDSESSQEQLVKRYATPVER